MNTLYLTKQDSVLRKVDERLKVTHYKETILDIPMIKVSQVVIFGRVTVTPDTIYALSEKGISLCYLTEHGRYMARIEPPFTKNSILRKAQYKAAFDENRSADLARGFIKGKLANMRVMLVRAHRQNENPEIAKAIERIKNTEKSINAAKGVDSLMGYEGEGTAAYFSAFSELIKKDDFEFNHRTKRPPKDPVNSLLSFGYTLLANNLHSAINIVGLDPYIGYLHADKYGKPSLALDLMEEFRPIIVDSLVLMCINKRIIQKDDFVAELGSIYRLKDEARKKFLIQYEERKNTEIKHPIFDYTVTYQRCFELQTRLLSKCIQGEIDKYPPFIVK